MKARGFLDIFEKFEISYIIRKLLQLKGFSVKIKKHRSKTLNNIQRYNRTEIQHFFCID